MLKHELICKLNSTASSAIPMWLKRVRKDILEYVIKETIPYNSKSIMEMVYIVLHGPPPKCSDGNYRVFNTYEKGYRIGCSLGNKCIDVLNNRVSKQKVMLLEKYGVTNISQLDYIKEKIKKTNIEKYGVLHHSQNSIIKEKTIQTKKKKTKEQLIQQQEKTKKFNLKKYGVEHHMKLESQQEKVKNTNYIKYGVSHPLQNEDCVKKMQLTYAKNNNISDLNQKRKQTILEKYGVDAISRIKVPKTTIDILTNEHKFTAFIENKTREEVITELQIHDHTLYLYAKKYNAVNLFKTPLISNFEKEVGLYLTQLNVKFTQNDRTIINPQEIDFYIPANKLAIECCGLYWHSENATARNKNYHFNKFLKCKEQNITLLTIFQDEWDDEKEKIKNRIRLLLDLPTEKIYARNCTVKEITTNIAKKFIDDCHIQSYSPSSIKLGLYHGSELCSVMTFGKPRYNKEYQYELIRYCSIKNIVGGTDKMFNYFTKIYNPKNIISYSDNRYFSGNMYKSLGFTENGTTIGYFYTDYHKRFNRMLFQKHKLIEQGYDKNKSEWQLMQELGYDRIWDCGQTAWNIFFDK